MDRNRNEVVEDEDTMIKDGYMVAKNKDNVAEYGNPIIEYKYMVAKNKDDVVENEDTMIEDEDILIRNAIMVIVGYQSQLICQSNRFMEEKHEPKIIYNDTDSSMIDLCLKND